ncbi:MAG TPA: AMP-binding protein [Acidimicrobiales bacterium]|nr:AMP-binding protein [Acidimicrobiales bacterium]
MRQHNLWRIFDAVAEAKADQAAIRWRGRSTTYRQLRDRAIRFANVLHDHGIGLHAERRDLQPWESGQDLVATYLLNSPAYLEVGLGGSAARAAPFNVNHHYVADELAHLLRDASPRTVVYHARFAEQLAEVLPALPVPPLLLHVADDTGRAMLPGAVDLDAALAGASPELAVEGHDPDDLYVLYTGGTTGMPKGTLWRQADIWLSALGGDFLPEATLPEIVDAATGDDRPRFLPNAPFMHAAAHWTALRTLLAGGTVVVNGVVDRLDPVDVWTSVAAEHVDMTMMVGEAFARPLLDELESGAHDPSSLAVLVLGGAPTSIETKRRILELLPDVLLVDGAGSTETGGALRAVAVAGRVGQAGVFKPSPGTAVLDHALQRVVEPGHAEPGWFAKRGAIPLGYLGDEAKTRAAFPVVDGVRWAVPGDRARLLADGTVQLLGREATTVNTGGEKVFGEEVEAALLAHPAVEDVLVVGRDSDRWGQEVVAVVALRDEVDDADLLEAASSRLARFKVPKAIVRVEQVRRSPAGKADYAWARAVASAAGAAPAPSTDAEDSHG